MSVAACGRPDARHRLLAADHVNDPLHRLIAMLPRPLRFIGVGGLGLVSDLGLFTIMVQHGYGPLLAQFVSLIAATLLTWRLNRAFTFDRSGRHPGDEVLRYALVTATAQGTSYAIFAALVLTICSAWPQVALLIGAAVAAFLSYNGHRLFAFAPRTVDATEQVKP